ncbi:MAG: VIT and VWA domain-containing protein, partial [candidate division WOR-3 bacterium]
TIGRRTIEAHIEKREDARKAYEQAREQGKSASLLEQQRPNVFQMNVANIMPGDVIRVELRYTETIVPTDRIYEFVYPTVVGPRYSGQRIETAPPSERWVENPYLHQQEAPGYAFDISVSLTTGLPIRDLSSPSHKVNLSYDGPAQATVALDPSERHGGNRDYILRYRLDGDRVQSGLLLYQGEQENFFLLMMQPPIRLSSAHIPGREYIFIVDVSGSMHGFPLEISKALLKNLIGNLRPTDLFNVLLFSGGSSIMAEESLPATTENINRAVQLIGRQQGGGGTELLPALKRALSLKQPKNYSRTIVIATDGFVTVEEEVFDLIRANLGRANIFPFGIGTSVNRHIIEGMAHVGMGEPFVITSPEQAASKAERFRAMIASPVLTQVNVQFRGFETHDVEPVAIPDVLAERPVLVFGKWRGTLQGRITLSGISGDGVHTDTLDVGQLTPQEKNGALQYLWARHRIRLLSDYNRLRPNDTRIKEITHLGLAYRLLTAHT